MISPRKISIRNESVLYSRIAANCYLLFMKTIIGRSNEYHIPLYIVFTDFEKAFNSFEHWTIKNSSINIIIDHTYTEVLTITQIRCMR